MTKMAPKSFNAGKRECLISAGRRKVTLLVPSSSEKYLNRSMNILWSDLIAGTDEQILASITRTNRPVNRSVLKIEHSEYDYCFTTSTYEWFPIRLDICNEEEE